MPPACYRTFTPGLQRGNLQDAINANSINGTHFPEKEMVKLFKGTCEAVRAMHDFHARVARPNPNPSRENQSTSHARSTSGSSRPQANVYADNGHSDDEEDELFPHPEGDAEGGYSYHGPARQSSVPLVTKRRPQDEGETIYDGDEELARMQGTPGENGNASGQQTELVPYAHRDLKPGCVICYLSTSRGVLTAS